MQSQRFYSLDVFRGLTVAFMILVNNAGDWDHIFWPLEHAPWHGLTPTDLVFPFFLFAVGNALSFVMPRLKAAGQTVFLKKVFKRSLIIFLIGLALNWFPFLRWQESHLVLRHWVNPENPETGVRILGVLQRIALCYFFASLIIYYLSPRAAFATSLLLLAGYWLLCQLLGQAPDPFSLPGYFGTAIDKAVLGVSHMYRGEHVPFDPEGIASTLPAISGVIYGYLVGRYIQEKGKNFEMTTRLFVTGCVLVFMGFCWDLVFPINKKIWTSSFVVYTTGLAILILATLIDLIEFRGWKGPWTRFFDVFGKNPLFIFVLSGAVPRLLGLIRWQAGVTESRTTQYLTPLSWFYEHICKPLSSDLRIGSLVFALCTVTFYWLIAYLLDRNKVYIKV